MATIDKDFKVKNGLVVALGGSFGGTVEVGTPTDVNHATTKQYVDEKVGTYSVPTYPNAPDNPIDGQLYFNTTTRHISIYSDAASDWIMIATFADTADLRQHIHDQQLMALASLLQFFKMQDSTMTFFHQNRSLDFIIQNIGLIAMMAEIH